MNSSVTQLRMGGPEEIGVCDRLSRQSFTLELNVVVAARRPQGTQFREHITTQRVAESVRPDRSERMNRGAAMRCC